MRGVVFLGNRKMELGEIPDPKVREGDVLVRVKASAICGSEMETFVPPTGLPWKGNPGHEVMGIIEDPNGSKRFRKVTPRCVAHSYNLGTRSSVVCT